MLVQKICQRDVQAPGSGCGPPRTEAMAFGSHHLAQTCTGLLQNQESNGKEDGKEVGGSLFHGGTLPMRLIKGLLPKHKTPQPQNLHTPNRKLCCVFPVSEGTCCCSKNSTCGPVQKPVLASPPHSKSSAGICPGNGCSGSRGFRV